MADPKDVVGALVKLNQANLRHKSTAFQQILRYGGIKTIGNLLASRKGVFGLIAIALSYWLLLGKLPADAAPELIGQMGEVFGMIVGTVVVVVIGGTALEDTFKRGAEKTGPDWLPPEMAGAVGKAYDQLAAGTDEDAVAKELGRAAVDAVKKKLLTG